MLARAMHEGTRRYPPGAKNAALRAKAPRGRTMQQGQKFATLQNARGDPQVPPGARTLPSCRSTVRMQQGHNVLPQSRSARGPEGNHQGRNRYPARTDTAMPIITITGTWRNAAGAKCYPAQCSAPLHTRMISVIAHRMSLKSR